jgi:DNA polymerase IIIc chi subunit
MKNATFYLLDNEDTVDGLSAVELVVQKVERCILHIWGFLC